MSEKKREDEFRSLVRTPAHVYPSTRTGILLVAQDTSKWQLVHQNTICIRVTSELWRVTMSEATLSRPQVNGILETSLYVERPTRSVEFYRRVFGFEPIDLDQKEGITVQTRLCAMRAGDRSILLLFKKGATANTDATGAIHIAFGIARSELPAWEAWLSQQGIPIEFRKTWKYGGEALYFRDPDGHLLEVVTPGVWSIY